MKYDTAVKDKITLAGAGGTTITNLKDAALNESSTDAVTGKQLNKTNENLVAEETARTAKDAELEGKSLKTVKISLNLKRRIPSSRARFRRMQITFRPMRTTSLPQ